MQEYNTQKSKLNLPEYGRWVQQMVESIKTIEDKGKRSEQARAIVKVMEILNPQVHNQDDYERKLWDHLFIIAGYDLDIDAPFPAPTREQRDTPPMPIPVQKNQIKATHYGRNIIGMIDLVAELEDGPTKTEMIRCLAIYMRQQYLIWNKDNVADETIFNDMVKLSEGKISIPEGLELSKISDKADFSRPGQKPQGNNQRKKGRNNKGKK